MQKSHRTNSNDAGPADRRHKDHQRKNREMTFRRIQSQCFIEGKEYSCGSYLVQLSTAVSAWYCMDPGEIVKRSVIHFPRFGLEREVTKELAEDLCRETFFSFKSQRWKNWDNVQIFMEEMI